MFELEQTGAFITTPFFVKVLSLEASKARADESIRTSTISNQPRKEPNLPAGTAHGGGVPRVCGGAGRDAGHRRAQVAVGDIRGGGSDIHDRRNDGRPARAAGGDEPQPGPELRQGVRDAGGGVRLLRALRSRIRLLRGLRSRIKLSRGLRSKGRLCEICALESGYREVSALSHDSSVGRREPRQCNDLKVRVSAGVFLERLQPIYPHSFLSSHSPQSYKSL